MKKSKNILLIILLLVPISLVTRFVNINETREAYTSDSTYSFASKVNDLNYDNISADKKSNNQFYRIISRYGDDNNVSFNELFDSENSLKRLKSINKEFNENFDYFELEFQPLYYIGYYDKEEKFVNSIKAGTNNINQVIANENGGKIYATDLKTVQLGKKCYGNFDKRIDIGSNFNLDDFNINNSNETVNVILGNDYRKYYNLGDTIKLTLHQKSINFKIIGFYKKDTFINCQGSNISLDQCIVMPFYEINYDPVDEKDDLYQKIYYSQKNEGYIRIPENIKTNDNNIYKNYLDKIEKLSEKFDLKYALTSSHVSIGLNP